MVANVPDWCRWRRGGSAVLIVAPHGGRREPISAPADLLRPRKVNDLHTADLAEELADGLDAALISNPAIDRNQLDLNRISQVAIRAPWFVALIETLLEEILARHERAEVLFIHGWNVIQPKCDIGVGQVLADPSDAPAHVERLTVSPEYASNRLGDLQARCGAAGIATTFGVRYPARHPNNLLQLFRHSSAAPAMPPRLAAWTAARRIEAVQLELGVPVRWPGKYRRAFLAAARAAFACKAPVRSTGITVGAAPAPEDAGLAEPQRESAASLQLYDPRADVGLTARVDRAGPHAAGRLLLFLGRTRLALFIGEDPRHAVAPHEGPHFTATAHGLRLRFMGPALASDDGPGYVDLEHGFASSQLCAIEADLEFQPQLAADYGRVHGWIAVDGERRAIDTQAFARHGVLQGPPGAWSTQLILSIALGASRAVRIRHEFPGSGALRELTAGGEAAHALPLLTVRFNGDRYTPEHICLGRDLDLVGEPLTRMAITRPLPPHRHARVTFGVARFRVGAAEGYGFYEYARAVT